MDTQSVSNQGSNMTENTRQPNSQKKTWIILAIILVLVLLAFGIIWFFVSARNDAAEDASRVNNAVNYAENTTNTSNNAVTNTSANITSNTTNTTATPTATIPSTLSKATLNGVSVYYPKSWGSLKVNTSQEKIDKDGSLGSTYEGAYLSLMDTPFTYVSVMNASSYRKDADSIKEVVTYLEKVYTAQAVKEADVNNLVHPLIPVQNAGIKVFHPQYLYSKDSNWRGFWYLGNIAQEPGLSPYVVGLLYNKKEDKVYTYERVLTSATITQKQNQLNPDNSQADAVVASYLGSGYLADSEAMTKINEFLQMAEYTGM